MRAIHPGARVIRLCRDAGFAVTLAFVAAYAVTGPLANRTNGETGLAGGAFRVRVGLIERVGRDR